jgi:FMN phosphatase YigB (HAD superfamily)
MADVTAIIFDVGEVLVDESRLWLLWADWLGVPHAAFMAELDSVIQQRIHHRTVFERFRAGFDTAAARRDRERAGWPPDLPTGSDLYADAIPCLTRVRAMGYWLGIAGNQPAAAERALTAAGISADAVGSSGTWGVEKPSAAFFDRLVELAGRAPAEIAYVGDRLDNDVLPAIERGMVGVFIERGPWGRVHATWPEAARASIRVRTLDELPAALG